MHSGSRPLQCLPDSLKNEIRHLRGQMTSREDEAGFDGL